MAKTPFSKTWFGENNLGPKPGGLRPVKWRPRRPLENRKRTIQKIDLAGWGFCPPPIEADSGWKPPVLILFKAPEIRALLPCPPSRVAWV